MSKMKKIITFIKNELLIEKPGVKSRYFPEKKDHKNHKKLYLAAFAGAILCATIIYAFSELETRYRTYFLPITSWHVERLKKTTKNADIILIGDSKIYRHFDENLANEYASECGCSLTFMNTALPGMSTNDFFFLLDLIDKNKSLTPKIIAYKPLMSHAIRWNVFSDNVKFTNRPQYALANLLLMEDCSIKEYLIYLKSIIEYAVRYGQTSRWIRQRYPDKYYVDSQPILNRQNGYLDLENDPHFGLLHKRHTNFLKEKNKNFHIKKLGIISEKQKIILNEAVKISDRAAKFYKMLTEAVKGLGAEPVFIFPPTAFMYKASEIKHHTTVYSKNRLLDINPQEYPVFNDINLWYDQGHLNREGSIIFTKIIVDSFCGGE